MPDAYLVGLFLPYNNTTNWEKDLRELIGIGL